MNDFVLQEDDHVYIPSIYCTIETVEDVADTNLFKVRDYTFYNNGYGFYGYHNANRPAGKLVFPATQEWYDKLVTIYPDLEPPPKRKEPREIIEAMLKAGYDGVPCKTDYKQYRFVCTDVSNDQHFPFVYDNVNNEDDAFSSAIPYCCKTGKIIIDFIDGEVVLED